MKITLNEKGLQCAGLPNVGNVLIDKWGERHLVTAVGEKSFILKNITPWYLRIICKIRRLISIWQAEWRYE